MASSQRPVVQPIPPFKGGPLQATDVQNRRPTAAEAYVALANRKAGANVVSTRATGSENRHAATASAHTAHYSQSQQQQQQQQQQHHAQSSHRQQAAPAVDRRHPQQQAAERAKPSSRLEREKKRHHNDPKQIGHWRLDKLIGQGASGRVRLAVHDQTGQRAAVKIIPRTLINASRMSLRDADVKANKMILGIEREIVIMKLIEHPNLLGLWDVYETSKDLFLIMEYVAGGELFDHLVAQGKLSPRDARSYFRQIIFGMDYCHRFNICHRDLKPENLLLDETKKIVKVADFGMAALQPTEKMLETSCGSPHYASPEIVSGKRYKGTASDIWSCGIILFALLCGRLPFDDPNIQQLLGKVRAGKFAMPEWLEPASKDLIWRMLEVDPEKRIKMADIMRHPWFTNNGRESSVNPVATSFQDVHLEELQLDTIDIDILGNLKTLWSELSEEDIVRELLAPGSNWQKTFYTLLVAHRENHSADEEEEEEFLDEEIMTASTAMPVHAMLNASGAPGAGLEKARPRRIADATSAPNSPRLESVEMDRRHSTPEKPGTSTARTSPHVRPANPSPRLRPSTADSSSVAATSASPVLGSPTKLRAPATIKPVASGSGTRDGASSANAAAVHDYKLPQISLQTASPQRNERAAVELQRRATSPTQKQAAASGAPSSRITAMANLQDATGMRARSNRTSPSEMMAPLPLPGPRASSRPVSPTKPSMALPGPSQPHAAPLQRPSTARAHTVQGPPSIQVPQVGDATMQKFFQDIADELASIRATGEKPDALQSKIEQLKNSVAAQHAVHTAITGASASVSSVSSSSAAAVAASSAIARVPVPSGSRASTSSAASSRSPAARYSEINQFEDAEDDVSEGESMRSVSEASTSHPYTPQTPMTPLSPPEITAPLAVADKPARPSAYPGGSAAAGVSSTARGSVRSVRAGASSSSTATTSNSRPSSVFSNISTGSTGLGRKRSLLGLRKGDRNADDKAKTISYDQTHGAATPQTLASVFAPAHSNGSAGAGGASRVQKLNPGLGLDIGTSNAYTNGSSVSSSAASTPVGVLSPPATPLSPSPGVVPGKKDSWFAGLFNWKPATFTLMSTENFSETLSETVRRLQSYGVRVAMDESSDTHHTTLKCTISEYRESNGAVTAAKPLRFRVEFTILPVGSPANSSPLNLGLGLSLHGTPAHAMPSPALSNHSRSSNTSSAGVMFATSVQVVQEKGALSTFKLIHARLRREWSLDQPNSAII